MQKRKYTFIKKKPQVKLTCIYCIRNKINNKVYIGSTKWYKKRINIHKNQLKRNKHYSLEMQSDYNIYGFDNFEYIILLELGHTDNLEQEEQWFMDIHKDYLYNLDSANRKIRKPETMHRVLLASKGNKSRTGHKFSEETKKKMSEAQIQRHLKNKS